MAMTRKERLAYVLDCLDQHERLERKATDDVGWIALKLSTSRDEAARLITQALKLRTKQNADA